MGVVLNGIRILLASIHIIFYNIRDPILCQSFRGKDFEHDDLPRFTWCQTRSGNLRRKFTEKPWILSSMRLSHSNRWQLNFMSWLSTIFLSRFRTARLSIRRSFFPALTTIAFQNTTRWNQRWLAWDRSTKKHRKNCECCPAVFDCKSLTLNVMIQVSQFVRNSQLCHCH